MRSIDLRGGSFTLLLLLACLLGSGAHAQGDLNGLDVFPNLSLGNLGANSSEPAEFRASYQRDSGDAGAATRGTLSVTARMQPDWHVYSLTQPAGGPLPTKLTLSGPAEVKLLGEFKADRAPQNKRYDAWPGLTIEEHEKEVTWSAPIQLPAGFDAAIEVTVASLVCKTDGSCVPLNKKLVAAQRGGGPDAAVAKTDKPKAQAAEAAKVEPFRNKDSVVQWSGQITPAQAAPGSRAMLRMTAKPDDGYHVYAAAVDDTESRTNFVITDKAGLKVGAPQPPGEPIVKTLLPGLPPVQYHEGEITWTLPIEVSEAAGQGKKTLTGMIGYQACTDTSCLQPRALRFSVDMDVAAAGSAAGVAAVRFEAARYAEVMDAAALTRWVDPLAAAPQPPQADRGEDAVVVRNVAGTEAEASRAALPLSMLAILAMGLGGGLILNLMPCVLPVVGLKIMSFASQAGENRRKVLGLNAAYTLGILIVFWALAALAIVSTYSWGREFLGIEGQLSWGQQFQFFAFRYGVILLVFALALSFLGVWEIPLPGFVGGKSTQQLQRQEGFSGAFFKGIFTTLLATPCSGPLLGTVFAYTLGKSAWVILAIFTSIGLGMALPYLMIALFPRLIVLLPKPGAWMDTLKQLLGFLLLATVAFIFSFFPNEDMLLVFVSLIGVWFGCWIIGSVPNWEALPKRLSAWGGGIGVAVAGCFLAFWVTAAGPVVVAWEPYDEARLQQLQREGRTVLVDFTAKWCVNCIVNYNVALNTEQTGRLVRELDAVAMLADWTDHNEEIRAKLQELQSNSIPVLAIFPGGDPDNPIVLRDLVTQGEVLTALRQAGPSLSEGSSRVAQRVTDDRSR